MAATADTIAACIQRRVGMPKLADLIRQFGIVRVTDALDEAGSFYAGVEEIGSSDIYYFTETFYRFLGVTAEAKQEAAV
jgi:hypothetical protein